MVKTRYLVQEHCCPAMIFIWYRQHINASVPVLETMKLYVTRRQPSSCSPPWEPQILFIYNYLRTGTLEMFKQKKVFIVGPSSFVRIGTLVPYSCFCIVNESWIFINLGKETMPYLDTLWFPAINKMNMVIMRTSAVGATHRLIGQKQITVWGFWLA
jgi:hypothetical protein